VATVEQAGPAVDDLEIGQRVVLNPWLSCGPRGIDPPCPECEQGNYSACWSFVDGRTVANHVAAILTKSANESAHIFRITCPR
jgi:threonine dehydrogenase-like Zn-dependent dehydrogenase